MAAQKRSKPKQPFSLKRTVAKVHSWAGAFAFLVIFLVTLSGIGAAFLGDLFRLQHPEIYGARSFDKEAPRAPLDELVSEAATSFDGQFTPLGVNLPGGQFDIDEAFVYGFAPKEEVIGGVGIVVLDPYQGDIIGTHPLLTNWGYLTVHFHEQLLLGDTGLFIVAVSGVILLLFAISGLYQWLPRRGRILAKATDMRLRGPTRAKMFRLHGLLGIWLALPFILFAFTGAYIAKPNWFMNAFPEIGPALSPKAAAQLTDCDETEVPLADALSTVERELPNRDIIGLTLPMTYSGAPPEASVAYAFSTRKPGDLHKHEGDARIWVSSKCPGLFHLERVDRTSGRETIGAMIYSLHSGRTFGALRLPVLIISGLGLLILSGAGLYVWWSQTFGQPPKKYK